MTRPVWAHHPKHGADPNERLVILNFADKRQFGVHTSVTVLYETRLGHGASKFQTRDRYWTMVCNQTIGLTRVQPGHEVFNQPAMCQRRESCEMAIPSRAALGFNAAATEVRSK